MKKNRVNIYNESGRARLTKNKLENVALAALNGEGIAESEINIILLDDQAIHEMNREYLSHDYPTDVISFQLDEEPLSGEVYISADTAEMQAKDYNVSLTDELMRLAVHGTLHIIGYDDASPEERAAMSALENKYMEEALRSK